MMIHGARRTSYFRSCCHASNGGAMSAARMALNCIRTAIAAMKGRSPKSLWRASVGIARRGIASPAVNSAICSRTILFGHPRQPHRRAWGRMRLLQAIPAS